MPGRSPQDEGEGPDRIGDGVVELVPDVEWRRPEDCHLPTFQFRIELARTGDWVGSAQLRIGHDPWFDTAGHVGVVLQERFRGHGYASRSVRLLGSVASRYEVRTLTLTCSPENRASRRLCEGLGAEFEGIFEVPPGHSLYQRGERRVCRYSWALDPLSLAARTMLG